MKHGMDRVGRTVTVAKAVRSCFGKKRYPNKNKAGDRAALFLREGKADQRPYRCALCGGWHLATVKAKPQAQAIVAPQLRKRA